MNSPSTYPRRMCYCANLLAVLPLLDVPTAMARVSRTDIRATIVERRPVRLRRMPSGANSRRSWRERSSEPSKSLPACIYHSHTRLVPGGHHASLHGIHTSHPLTFYTSISSAVQLNSPLYPYSFALDLVEVFFQIVHTRLPLLNPAQFRSRLTEHLRSNPPPPTSPNAAQHTFDIKQDRRSNSPHTPTMSNSPKGALLSSPGSEHKPLHNA